MRLILLLALLFSSTAFSKELNPREPLAVCCFVGDGRHRTVHIRHPFKTHLLKVSVRRVSNNKQVFVRTMSNPWITTIFFDGPPKEAEYSVIITKQ